MDPECVFCVTEGGVRVYRDDRCRVVVTDEPFVGFCRVIANAHVREITDLPDGDRQHLLRVVLAVETALRKLLQPDKMNVASLGNMTPHVHWHVIPRFADDSHFPQPVWGTRQRDAAPRALPDTFVARLAQELTDALAS